MSCSRHCSLEHAVDGTWWAFVGNFEYAHREDSTAYGPFQTCDIALDFVVNGISPNAGGVSYSANQAPEFPVPTVSPNGEPLEHPRKRWFRGEGYQWSLD